MIKITVESRTGAVRSIDAEPGMSLMEALRENGFDEILALCGGCCSCATCHVHVDLDHTAALSPMSDDEDALLDSSDDRDATSRLSCQLPITPELDGISVRIAAED